MKIKLHLALILLLFVSEQLFGQNIYNFTTASNGAPNFVAANLSATNLSPVNGNGTNTPCTNGGGISGLTIGSTIPAYNPASFALDVDLTPAAGYLVNVTDITVNLRRSSTGPANARFAYSINGGTTWIDKGSDDFPNNGSCGQFSSHSWTLPTVATAIAPAMFKFRIYFFNASNPSSGTLQVANLYINGSVQQACTTPVVTISGGGSICNGTSTNITFTGTPNSTVTYTKNGVNQVIVLSAAGTAVLNTGTLTSNTVYSLVSAVNGACSANLSGNATIIMKALPTVVVTPSNDSVCLGQGKVLNATGANTYSWSPSATLSASTGASVTATPTGLTIYTVTGTGTNSCINTATATIKTIALPTIVVTPSNDSVCLGQTKVLSATGANTYNWAPSATLSSSTGASVTATPTGLTTYTVTGTAANTCVNTATATIKTLALPVVVVTPSYDSVCIGQGKVLNATGAITYTWTPTATLSSSVGSSVTATPTGLTTYTVTGTDANTCVNTATATIKTLALPAVVVTPSNDSVCLGQGKVLTASGASTYSWTPSATLSGPSGASVIATPIGLTTYTVTGTAANTCVNTATTTIKTLALPTATITPATSPVFCPGGSVLMNANTGSGLTYQWKLNGNNIAGATNSSYAATNAGDYTVVVTNSNGCSFTSAIQNVISNTPPPATVTPSSVVNICTGTSTTLSANTGTGLTYQWRFNGSDIAGATNITYNTGNPGNYTVRVIAGPNCSNLSAGTDLALLPLPGSNISPTGTSYVCPGNSFTLNAAPTSGFSYQWLKDNVVVTGATNAGYAASLAGNYRVIVTNTTTSCKDTATAVAIAIAPLPAANISYNTSTSFCEGDQMLTMSANTGQGLTYQWQAATANIAGATNIDYTTGIAGSYRVVVTNSYGCSVASAPVAVTTFPKPQGSITYSNPLVFCQGGAVALNATAGSGYTYHWYKNSVEIPSTNTPVRIVDSTGIYAVLITNSFNCTVFSTGVGVTVNPKPEPVISRNGMQLSTSNYITYQWYLNSQPIGSATNQTYMATANGGYTVNVTDANGCVNMSKLVFVNDLGVNNANSTAGIIDVYPNPVHDILHINSPVPVKCIVQDPTGKTVVYPSVTHSIDLGGYAAGVYIIRIYDRDGQLLKIAKLSKID